MTPQPIGDVRCPYCLEEFENDAGGSAGDHLVDHLTDEHDHFRIDADSTCPLCAAEFEDVKGTGPTAKAQLVDHISTEHDAVYSRAVKIGLAGGK